MPSVVFTTICLHEIFLYFPYKISLLPVMEAWKAFLFLFLPYGTWKGSKDVGRQGESQFFFNLEETQNPHLLTPPTTMESNEEMLKVGA